MSPVGKVEPNQLYLNGFSDAIKSCPENDFGSSRRNEITKLHAFNVLYVRCWNYNSVIYKMLKYVFVLICNSFDNVWWTLNMDLWHGHRSYRFNRFCGFARCAPNYLYCGFVNKIHLKMCHQRAQSCQNKKNQKVWAMLWKIVLREMLGARGETKIKKSHAFNVALNSVLKLKSMLFKKCQHICVD